MNRRMPTGTYGGVGGGAVTFPPTRLGCIDLARGFPYNITRTWHLQLAILWVATAFLAAGIFLTPMIAGREPRGQRPLIYSLLVALVLVVVGSLAGEFSGIHGWIRNGWQSFGNQRWRRFFGHGTGHSYVMTTPSIYSLPPGSARPGDHTSVLADAKHARAKLAAAMRRA